MHFKFPKALATILLVIIILCAVEVVAQIRSHFKFGQSVLTRATQERPYSTNQATGLTLFRPNVQFGGKDQVIRSNSFGLRSNEIPLKKPPGHTRIVVMGASTVMGAYASENSKTFSALLEDKLNNETKKPFEVINGGFAGLTLKQQTRLFDKLLANFEPDVTIVYTGFNDFATYCTPPKKPDVVQAIPLNSVQLPKWLLSIELLLKNTVALRAGVQNESLEVVDADALDISNYVTDLEKLIETLGKHDTLAILVTNAKSYRRDQPMEAQKTLSETARFYNHCFDLSGLHRLHERHNDAIVNAAMLHNLQLFRLDDTIPGGKRYFADASHFSEEGEEFVANWLTEKLQSSGALNEVEK